MTLWERLHLGKRKVKAAPPSPQLGRRYPAEWLTRPEIDALLTACGQSAIGTRNRALIIVLWRTGLRISEALDLEIRDVDFAGEAIRVRRGKGDKSRTVALDSGTADAIHQWLRVRDLWDVSGSLRIFCTRRGTPVLATYVRPMLERLAKRAGVSRRVHPHMFRHTYAVELVRAGVPVPYIQRLLGHSSLATTTTYLASLSPEEALDAVRGRAW